MIMILYKRRAAVVISDVFFGVERRVAVLRTASHDVSLTPHPAANGETSRKRRLEQQ